MPHVLLICGSVRTGSTNAAALVTAEHVAPAGVTTTRYHGLHALPHFNPDLDGDPLPAPVAQLRELIEAADALLFSTPEYAGALPGSMKNLLDWTVGGTETSGKPCGWLNISTAPSGAAGAHAELAVVLRYTDAHVVEAACARIPIGRNLVADGVVTGARERAAITAVLTTLAEAVANGVQSTP